ncbi:disease resistance protein RPH8A-like [Salvia splendens]|uniref:disease resistance protein RPH8A-like n=1 Tax=Salvia splendens TaxID=180675 RepID=UPI001C269C3C|nr:disease resistance protein RPH8A-like [Salvia splendens]
MPKSVHHNAENSSRWVVIGVGVGVAGVLIATYYVLRFMLLWVVIGICIAADVYRRQLRPRSTVKEDCGAMNINLSGNTSESIILVAIQKMERVLDFNVDNGWDRYIDETDYRILEEVINELRMVVDFLRDKSSGERSLLQHLVAEFADAARHSAELVMERKFTELDNALGWVMKSRMLVMEAGAGEKEIRPQSVGVVGLEKDVKQLCKVILNEEPGLVTMCVKGMVGVGKTTLATQVYNNAAIVERFKHHRAWIALSSDTDTHEMLVNLIQQLMEQDGDSLLVEEMGKWSLMDMICDHLRRIPCFIVLENPPPNINFTYFFLRLRRVGNGSRLLITSRREVTTLEVYYTHEMKSLDSDQSWKLFMKIVDKFTGHENKLSKELESRGKEMLKNCGGLPIAIIDVGRQKAKERLSGIAWEEVFDSIDLSESLKKLEPMYHELDGELKACFLHMSFFKENAIMRNEKLEQIWAVSGLKTRRFAWATRVKSKCTYDLSSQSIIEVLDPYQITKEEVKRCRMNPLLHKLSVKKAEEEIGFEVLSSNGNNKSAQNPSHRVIHCGREMFIQTTNQEKNLVSLIFHGGGRYLDDAGQSYWNNFELLKMLDMEDFGVKTLSETMGTLIELRYLGLRNNYIQEIPHSFGDLKKLEVLDVALNFMVEMPGNILEIGSLHHIYMSNVIYQEPLKVDALENLETLTYISIYDWMYEVTSLEKMICLQQLGVEEVDENSDAGKLFASLAELEHLRHLTLRGFRFRSIPCLDNIGMVDRLWTLKLDGLLSRLPSANNFPQGIKYLALVNTCLDEDPMPLLKNLPWLECLKLRNAYTGRIMSVQFNGFADLLVLHINELWNLRNVQVEEGAKAMLEQLEIKNCPRLDTLPQEIGSMKRLRKFKMVTTKRIATKIRNSGLMSKIVEVDISP